MSEKDLINSNIYKKCYAPRNLFYSMQLHLCYNGIFLGVVSLYRTKEEGNFTDDEMFLLKALMDHLNIRFYKNYKKSTMPDFPVLSMTSLASKYNLTNRETEILQLVLSNENNEQIADKLCISSYTLKKHLQNIYKKFNVSSRWDLLKFCKSN